MPVRMYPSDYLGEYEEPRQLVEPTIIPSWVPILIGICIIGSFIIALYALSLTKKERIVYREHGETHG